MSDRWSEADDVMPCLNCGKPRGTRHMDCKSYHVNLDERRPEPVTYYPIGSRVGVPHYDLGRAVAYARRWGGTLVMADGTRVEHPMPVWLARLMPKPGPRHHALDMERR